MPYQRYLALFLLAMTLLSGCGGSGSPASTAIPFARFTAQQVLDTLANAGLSVENVQRDRLVGRDAPTSFSDRYIFEIDDVAPDGGQVLVFDHPAALQEWQAYIERLRSNSSTRRNVVYTYVHANIILQINANLLPERAQAYRDALESMG